MPAQAQHPASCPRHHDQLTCTLPLQIVHMETGVMNPCPNAPCLTALQLCPATHLDGAQVVRAN